MTSEAKYNLSGGRGPPLNMASSMTKAPSKRQGTWYNCLREQHNDQSPEETGMRTKCYFLPVVITVLLTTWLSAAPVRWEISDGGNGHWYEAVSDPDINWTDAT